MTQFERCNIGSIRLHVLPTDRFKTYALAVFIGQPLNEEWITAGALTPYVLRRGNRRYPETRSFRMKLDELYGAGFGFDISKRGDYQIAQFRMDIINDRFVNEGKSFLKEALQYVGETLTDPYVEGHGFKPVYVAQEKETLKRRIESLINDKIRYAAERCIEEMCKGDPYRLSPLGKLEHISNQSEETLYQYYQEWLNRSIIDVYVVGDTTLKETSQYIKEYFKIPERSQIEQDYRQTAYRSDTREVKRVTDRLDVTQGKLNMGFRAYATYSDEAYPAALMYNGILGGYPHSKLFVNVREKASLAYYAASRLDGHKGILTIQSGIEIKNKEKAAEIILKQIDAMKEGSITDLEIDQTRAMMTNQLREIQDSAFEMIGFDFNRVLSGTLNASVGEMIEAISRVDKNQIQQYAEKVELDTIYFLRNREGRAGDESNKA